MTAASILPPEYRIGLDIRNDAVMAVRIAQDRPLNLERLVIGRPAEDAPDLLALVLALCADAHRAASRGAIALAAGASEEEEVRRDRARKVLAERVLNGVWRLAIDWPRAVSIPERPDLVVGARRAVGGLARSGGLAELRSVVSAIDQTALVLAFAAAGLFLAGDATEDESDPDAAEPSIAVRVANGLRDPGRAVAALARLLDGEPPAALSAGDGGRVMTTRGVLRHSCRLENGRIADYSVSVPTDVILAPTGPLSEALLGLSGSDLIARAQMITAIFDPCAPLRFEQLEDSDA